MQSARRKTGLRRDMQLCGVVADAKMQRHKIGDTATLLFKFG
jgi:hypothetical protein